MSACNSPKATSESGSRIVSKPEVDYCSGPVSVTNPTTITGTAIYQARTVTASGLIGAHSSSIRYSEVRVLDSSGRIVQCGETDGSGNFSLQIETPAQSSDYTVQVNSRANNNQVKASVLKDIYANEFHSITSTVSVPSTPTTTNVGSLVAPYDGTVAGGAFNILDQILKVNEYLRANTTDSNCASCAVFTVAPKLNIYWSPGVSPSVYGAEDLSFYDRGGGLAGTAALFILGGLNGDLSTTDTDHFDNSIIIHEYGHFLVGAYSSDDSPGGFHDGNSITDPRLAFSEGFPNFLSLAVSGSSVYRDTAGNTDGSTQTFLNINFEVEVNGLDAIETTNPAGEGIFREISVSRALWDYIDSNNETNDALSLPFAYIWNALTHGSLGLKSSSVHFRTIAHFNKALKAILSTSYGSGSAEVLALQNIIDLKEYQRSDTTEYGDIRSVGGASCSRALTPTNQVYVPDLSTGDPLLSYNKHTSADYIQYYHNGGTLNLKLVYTQINASNPTDLNMYLFTEDFAFESQPYFYSAKSLTLESPVGTEEITITAPAGYYLVQIRYNQSQGTGAGASYNLMTGSQYLCP